MKILDSFSAFAQILNFLIILYFVVIYFGTDCMSQKDIIISFTGLFASLIVNIISIIDRKIEK